MLQWLMLENDQESNSSVTNPKRPGKNARDKMIGAKMQN
jgi:hypothetical protein